MRGRAVVLTLALGLVTIPVAGAPAFAHDTEVATQPADGAVLTEPPARVVIEFDARIMDVGEALVVRSADGVVVSTGTPVVEGRALSTAVRTDVPAGTFTVAYRIVSQDGHPLSSTFSYVVAGDPTASASPVPAPSPAPSAPSPAATAVAPSGSDDPPYVLIAVGIAVLLAVVIGALALSR